MSRYQKELSSREEGAQKKPYETPGITTFGSVAKLTQGMGGSHHDAGHGHNTRLGGS